MHFSISKLIKIALLTIYTFEPQCLMLHSETSRSNDRRELESAARAAAGGGLIDYRWERRQLAFLVGGGCGYWYL